MSALGAIWAVVGATDPGVAVPAFAAALGCYVVAAVLGVRAWRAERRR